MRHEVDRPRHAPLPEQGGPRHRRSASDGEVQQYLDVLRRRWWVIVVAAFVALGAAWWGERDRLPMYSAEVLLEQRREAPIVGGGLAGGQDFLAQIEIIRSRAVSAAVVDSLGLQLRVENRPQERSRIFERVQVEPNAGGGAYVLTNSGGRLVLTRGGEREPLATVPYGEPVEGPDFTLIVADPDALAREPVRFRFQDHQAAVQRLQRQVRVEPARAATLVRISYSDPDPRLAAAVVNTMAGVYREQRAQVARQQASRRREAIAGQLVGLADSLESAQREVVDYQRQAQFLDPSYEGGHVMSAVLTIENELRTLRFQEGLLSSLVAGIQSGEAGDESLHQILSLGRELVPAGPALHQRLQDLEIERARMTASTFGRLDADPGVQTVDSLIASTRSQIRTAAEQGLEHLRVRIQGAENRLAEMRGSMAMIPGQTAELSQLRQRANAVQDVVDALVDRYYEAQIAEAVEAGDVSVIDPAPVPLWPDGSRTGMVLIMGVVGGILIGGLAVLAMEYFDVRVRRAVDAEEITGLPLVAMVPRMRGSSRDPVTAALGRESFRSLRTNLHFAHGSAPRVLALSSATPREGKTTVAINLAASLAEKEGPETVLLVDADLRRPQVHRVFDLERSPGLTDVLKGRVSIDEAVRTSPLHPKLSVLPCGGAVQGPSELISSQAFEDLLEQLRERFDYVVIDTPPLLAVTDGAVIAKNVDGTLIVVRANQADRAAVTHAMEQLRQIDATLLGVVLNAVGTKDSDGRYAYAYYEDYLTETPDESGGKNQSERRHLLLGASSSRD